MSAAVSIPFVGSKDPSSGLNSNSVASGSGYTSRITTSPLPDLNSLPTDFIDHLLLITQAIANSRPPTASLTDHGSSKVNGSTGKGVGTGLGDVEAKSTQGEGIISLPLPHFQSATGDTRTQQIEANIGALVERLWKAESVSLQVKPTHEDAQSGEDGEKKAFPYPVSQAHPQSSSYPLSYPLGFDQTGPVLLTPANQGEKESPEGAVGAFERYSDESGLSAQEELRLLKAQVQDIARVCKVSKFNLV